MVSGVGLGCLESSQVTVPGSTASWTDIYQPIDKSLPPQVAAIATVETMAQYHKHLEDVNIETDTTTELGQSTAEVECCLDPPTQFTFPYSVKVGERIKQLIAAKNPTAARRFIPYEQGIQSAYNAKATTKAIKDHNLAVEKQRKPGPRTEVHWCRYQARLVSGEWKYSDKPCYMLEGHNTGFSSWDIVVRHLKEHHFEMHIPRSNTKKARVLIGSGAYEANRVDHRRKRKS